MGQRLGLRSTILAAAAASLLACHPASINDASETDTVVTRKAESYDYSGNRTYDIPDSIADLCNADTGQLPIGEAGASGSDRPGRPDAGSLECNEITHKFDAAILKEISKNLEALGYVRVHKDAGDTPDVAMLVGALSSNNWVAYTYYPWSYYYYWWPYYPGWGIYYPYYPTTSVVNYPTGSLLMELVSIKDADTEGQRTPIIWTGAVSGLLAQGDTDTATRVNQTIDQAFAQSAYLKVGKP
ncbi:MAG TPA: DUF4136 domain-containing protein [Polyangiaceae bacterium]